MGRIQKFYFGMMLAFLAGVESASPAAVTFTIDPTQGNTPINPYAYGSNGAISGTKITVSRLGGNRLTAYNWETNWSNCGGDCNGTYENDTYMGDITNGPAWAETSFHTANKAAGADSLVTLQLAGFVAADKAGTVPASQFAPPAGTRFLPILFVKPGAPGSYADPPNTTDGVVYIDEFVNYLVNHLGSSTNGGIKFYDLDNEPGIWTTTHVEIRNNDQPTYAEIAGKGITVATQTTAIDPGAQILGPVAYGWGDYINFSSASDSGTEDAIYDNGNWVPFLNYYLAQMHAASTTAGRRLLHYLDLHAYDEATDAAGNAVDTDDVSQDAATTRMQNPRMMWDPTYNNINNLWINCCVANPGPVSLIPRLLAAAAQYYPGTKPAFTEYAYGAGSDVSGGIAEADLLGIFGKYGCLATYWALDNVETYIPSAFNLYVDYDGAGSHFGDTAVTAVSSNIPEATVYAAKDSSHPNHLNVIILCKDYSANDTASVTLSNLGGSITSIRTFRFDSAITALSPSTAPAFTANTFTDTLPFRSASLYELTLSQGFPTSTPTITSTPSGPTNTPTTSPTFSTTRTATASPSSTPTRTPSLTPTFTATASSTSTLGNTATRTASATATFSPTVTVTRTSTASPTNSSTLTPSLTATPTRISTATSSPTTTMTFTATYTPSSSPTLSPTSTASPSPTDTLPPGTFTPTPPATSTPTSTASETASFSPTMTVSSTPTASTSMTPSSSPTASNTSTSTFTSSWTVSKTPTLALTATGTFTPTFSTTSTASGTPTRTPTWTATPTAPFTLTFTPSPIPTHTPTSTPTPFLTATPSFTPTVTIALSHTPTALPTEPVIFPNPVPGPGPVTLQFWLGNPAPRVEIKIFTTAFRMVREMGLINAPAGVNQVTLDLLDKWGAPLANGLYYVVVVTPQGRSVGKLLILR